MDSTKSGEPILSERVLVNGSETATLIAGGQLRWSDRILDVVVDALGRPKRLFIFVNPYGGKKSALKIFETEVKPLLDDANIDFTVQETKYQLQNLFKSWILQSTMELFVLAETEFWSSLVTFIFLAV